MEEVELYDMRTGNTPLNIHLVQVGAGAPKVVEKVELPHPGGACTVADLKQILINMGHPRMKPGASVDEVMLCKTFDDAKEKDDISKAKAPSPNTSLVKVRRCVCCVGGGGDVLTMCMVCQAGIVQDVYIKVGENK